MGERYYDTYKVAAKVAKQFAEEYRCTVDVCRYGDRFYVIELEAMVAEKKERDREWEAIEGKPASWDFDEVARRKEAFAPYWALPEIDS
ncbi:MAG: putative membrane protein [Halieaceae bacterium]